MLTAIERFWQEECEFTIMSYQTLHNNYKTLQEDLETCRLDSDRKQEDLQGRISDLEAELSVLKDMVSDHQATVTNYIKREIALRDEVKEVSDLRECEANVLRYRLDQQAQVIADKDASLLAASDKAIDDCAKIFALTSKVESLERNLSRYKNLALHMGYGGGVSVYENFEEFFNRGE